MHKNICNNYIWLLELWLAFILLLLFLHFYKHHVLFLQSEESLFCKKGIFYLLNFSHLISKNNSPIVLLGYNKNHYGFWHFLPISYAF